MIVIYPSYEVAVLVVLPSSLVVCLSFPVLLPFFLLPSNDSSTLLVKRVSEFLKEVNVLMLCVMIPFQIDHSNLPFQIYLD